MSVKWTEEQQKVIDLRDRNILVSAAAGSGKTAVLVERIISRITDENDPADVDRLLVVTYTEAAATEMKERIGAAIEKKLEEQPGNVNLEQQSTLIHNASIMTIHSFCLSVIRDHFHVIGIDPAFRIAEEGELRLLMQDVLEELIENFYAEGSEAFLNFVDQYGTGRNDQKIEELILQLYEYSRSYPQPEKWLKECVDNYEIDPEKMEEAAIKIEETDQLVKVKVAAGEGSLPMKAEAGKEITVVEQLGSPEEKETGMLKFHTELELQENSHIHLIQICMPSEGQTLINKVTAKAEKNARVSVTQLFLGTGNTYSEVNAGLLGREADLTAKIGYFLQKEQKLDINLIADHRGEKTTCDITAEGTLKDKAQKLFRGTIDFKKGACGAKGSEVEEVLLLSDDIVNKTIPLILCAEEDVEGNHGATIGELDEETLFYFAARGIGRKTAENMMARAKLEKLCPEIPDEETRQLVMEQLEKLMPETAREENADEA